MLNLFFLSFDLLIDLNVLYKISRQSGEVHSVSSGAVESYLLLILSVFWKIIKISFED